jgi:hypothetical protein
VEDVEAAANELAAGSPNWDQGATVAMEYSPIEGAADQTPVVKFFLYIDGERFGRVDLDGTSGNRPLPHLCMTCHGGSFPTGTTALNQPGGDPGLGQPTVVTQFLTDADVRLGSKFLPFDLSLYTFPRDTFLGGNYSKANQQVAFKNLNELIVDISPPANTGPAPSGAIGEVIRRMYANFDDDGEQDEDFLVSGWETVPEEPLRSRMYRDVVARNCRTCHIASPFAGLLFDDKDDFEDPNFFGGAPTGGAAQVRVCQQHVMPHAKITHDLFWTSSSPHEPSIFEAYGQEFMNAGGVGWDLTLCQNFGHAFNPVLGEDYLWVIQPIFDGVGTGTTSCVSCHIGSSAPSGLNLSSIPDTSLLPGNVGYGRPISYNLLLNGLVVPFDAPNSTLFQRIDSGTMPPDPNFSDLNQASKNLIEAWINAGAEFDW